MKVKENNMKLKLLRAEIVRQLMNSEWTPINVRQHHFKNDYFKFEYIDKKWQIYFSDYSKDDLEKYIPLWKFSILKYFFVDGKLKKYHRNQEISEMVSKADRFFEKNKDLHRDAKIEEVLK